MDKSWGLVVICMVLTLCVIGYYINLQPPKPTVTISTIVQNSIEFHHERVVVEGIISDVKQVTIDEGTPNEFTTWVFLLADLDTPTNMLELAYNIRVEECPSEFKDLSTNPLPIGTKVLVKGVIWDNQLIVEVSEWATKTKDTIYVFWSESNIWRT